MTRSNLLFMSLLFVVLAGGFSALAQPASQESDCPTIAENILPTLDTTCTGLERNAACYGYRKVTASFTVETVAPAFTNVGDQTPLITLKTLTTAPFDAQTGDWGVALMKVQANVPNSLPGQAVTFVLMGDTEVENAVPTEEALALPDPITVHTAAPAKAFGAPSESSEPLGEIAAEAELLADAVSEDGAWVRVAYQERPAWVLTISLIEAEAISELPALKPDTFTPMQAFYFRTGIGQSACEQAPDLLMVQGPEHFSVDIRANGADIRIGSTAVFKGSEVIALSGEVVIFPNTPNAIPIPAGHRAELCPSDEKNLGIDGKPNDIEFINGCVQSPPSPLSDPEWMELGLDALKFLPPGILNYPIPLEAACTPNPEWTETYTVQAGDTLSSISERSEPPVSWQDLMRGNCLTDTFLRVGQTLRVPFRVLPPPPPDTSGGEQPPPETGSQGWQGCGSCDTCGHEKDQCVLSPDGQCLWHPAQCLVVSAPPCQPGTSGDSDCDGIPDANDNCPGTPNPGQADWNRNGKGDACEDFDRDGLTDEREFQIGTKPDNPNTDGDRCLDGADSAPLDPAVC